MPALNGVEGTRPQALPQRFVARETLRGDYPVLMVARHQQFLAVPPTELDGHEAVDASLMNLSRSRVSRS
jgi:hypothetical protein